jgi:uncharacterized protein (UPF0332 family)
MISGIEALFTKARQSLAAAHVLIEDGYNDFAASRAYYPMFYVASALLTDLGQSYSSHSAVISAFGREFAKTGRLDSKYHRWLIDAQDLRNIGDYGVDSQGQVPKEYAETACDWAVQFIEAAERLVQSRK